MPDGINLLSQLMRAVTSVQGGPEAAKADSLAQAFVACASLPGGRYSRQ